MVSPDSFEIREDDLKGLVEGVGLELFGGNDTGLLVPGVTPPGENLDGTVPARSRRAELCELLSGGGMKSGNPSWLGDSGMVSRRGVEPPLAGGPHIGVSPSCAWISLALFTNISISYIQRSVMRYRSPLRVQSSSKLM